MSSSIPKSDVVSSIVDFVSNNITTLSVVIVSVFIGFFTIHSLFKIRNKKDKKDEDVSDSRSYKTIDSITEDKILIIKLNRPRKKNAFSKLMYSELENALRTASTNINIKVILLTGSGDFYSSGNDLSNFSELKHPLSIAKEAKQICYSFVDSFIQCTKPIIVSVNGPAIGWVTQ